MDHRVLKAGLHTDPVSALHPVSLRCMSLLFGINLGSTFIRGSIVLVLRGRHMSYIGVCPSIRVRPWIRNVVLRATLIALRSQFQVIWRWKVHILLC